MIRLLELVNDGGHGGEELELSARLVGIDKGRRVQQDLLRVDCDRALPVSRVTTWPPRTQPAPLYYLPAVLTPAQEIFLARRKAEVHDAAEKEWAEFAAERAAGVEEIREMRERVREEQDRKKAERESREEAAVEAKGMEVDEPVVEVVKEETKQASKVEPVVVVVEKVEAKEESKPEEKDDAMQADDDDAVEY
ncbi:hypothetical protein FIBSPDRAFT_1054247 [Athelia psychrophila]|uniref:Pinin/SDK/MemA protein domain-containing protein n=1 Tax=Athelia psychrophila TaxID=1759441 RepID=A0A167VLR9_9AGAM|nr:hypothetical protein FIBSPDRAFT_1054247 [Fibularhizoctonia sp. CBS 109695]